MTRQQSTAHEKHLTEKNRINELQRELEKYQHTIVDLENKNRDLNFQMLKDMDTLRGENQRLSELIVSHNRAMELKEDEIRHSKSENTRLQDEIHSLQRVNKDMQLYKENFELATAQLKQQQQQLQAQAAVQTQAQQPTAALTQQDDQAKKDLLSKLSEAMTREHKLKLKIDRLKQKLRKANHKILELLPYKMNNNADSDDILKKYRSMEYDEEPTGPAPSYLYSRSAQKKAPAYDLLPGEGSDVIRQLQKKYGFADQQPQTDHYNRQENNEAGPSSIRHLAEKYGTSNTAYPEARRAEEESAASVDYDEIKRFAEGEALKYRSYA